MGFGAVLQTASYGNIYDNSLPVINSDLNMLAASGVKAVRIDLDFAPWLQNNYKVISKVSTIVQQVKNDGLKLIIADAAAESYRNGGQLSWSQFQAAWINRVKTLASLYHPDYYIVVKEPGWYVPMVSDGSGTPQMQSSSSWLNLTSTLAATVLSASPNTKVGVSVAADSLGTRPSLYVPYLEGVETFRSISFIGFDIYTTTGFTSTENFMNYVGSGGKSIWIAEAWSSEDSFSNPANSALDASWINVLYYFAESQIHASMIIPFHTNDFSQYSSASTISSPTFFTSREPVFYSYKSIVTSNIA